MGKGDKKTKKGKISSGSFGVSRPRKSNADKVTAASGNAEEKPKAAKAAATKKK